jgi:hypothetical protein
VKDDDEAATPQASGTVDELVGWLRVQIAADSAPHKCPTWHAVWCLSPEVVDGFCFYCGNREDPEKFEEVQPSADTLARCEAHSRIVEFAAEVLENAGGIYLRTSQDHQCNTLRLLALAYQHRPGHQEAWRP